MKTIKNIAIIGCGKLGLPCGEVIADHNYNVCGYDIKPINSNKIYQCKTIKEVVNKKDLIFIAVPTPHSSVYGGENTTYHLPPKDFNYNLLSATLKKVNKHIKYGQHVVIISTVLPGTVREQLAPLIPKAKLIYNPYFIAMETVRHDMVNPESVIIGTKTGNPDQSVKKLINFYSSLMKNSPEYHVCTWEEGECIKIFYNTFISLKICFANMIQDVADRLGNINADNVANALKTAKKRIVSPMYMTPGMGDGGACHPRDNIALRYLAKKLNIGYDMFQNVVYTRDKQAQNLAKKVCEIAKKHGLPIVIVGKSYKPNVSYTEGSSSILVGNFIQTITKNITYCDPNTGDVYTSEQPAVFLLAHPLKTKKDIQKYCKVPRGSVIIDPWRVCDKFKHVTVIHYGNTRIN